VFPEYVHLRSANGPEFVAKDLRKWLAKTGAKTLYIEPGSPWENGYCESSRQEELAFYA
jgi:putative transposase